MNRLVPTVLLASIVLAGCASSGSHAEALRGAARAVTTTSTTSTTGGGSLNPSLTSTTEEEVTAATVSPPAAIGATTLGCGKERWDVKTGADAAARTVDLAHITDTTIDALDRFVSDTPVAREAPVETTVYRLTNISVTVDKLEADSDIHIVLDDGQGRQTIAEIPNPACVPTTSPFYAAIVRARASFNSHFPEREQFSVIDATATVTGVGFFDKPHGQRGAGPNAIELHPVLSITFGP